MTNATKTVQTGYSLMEALVAIGLLGAIVSALGPTLFASVRATSALTSSFALTERERVAHETLSSLFQNAVVVTDNDGDPTFKGESRQLRFAALTSADGELFEARLLILDNRLSLQIFSLDGAATAARAPRQETTLLSDVDHFSYFGSAEPGTPKEWRREWLIQDTPPSLVRIERRSGAVSLNPSRDYYLPVSAALHCAFDQVVRRCRQ